jgi:hypothetical protein
MVVSEFACRFLAAKLVLLDPVVETPHRFRSHAFRRKVQEMPSPLNLRPVSALIFFLHFSLLCRFLTYTSFQAITLKPKPAVSAEHVSSQGSTPAQGNDLFSSGSLSMSSVTTLDNYLD